MTPTLPAEQALDETDGIHLRRAIELANVARSRGNRPFGSVIVGADGAVLAEAWNRNGETGDCTAHAETEALRIASPRHSRDELAGATIYASGEPCVMCAGAIYWSNIRRVVFGIDAERLRVFRGDRLDQRDAELSCRDVFDASPTGIECIGPALLEEAAASHEGGWKT
ncbi:nucleoside deaminase [Pigmentiphaga kullae]|uniref:tRNA(Arg) A34 adenosine deaminase TadA n=1 Tax=Pigmentiphaga kullae TaxID=151784 RepID=A0A4Q7NKP4_9BURK|nr:nucleoside deaminase [Pigmentiphaga kullae]RZS85498.1 tRNA(Arg) A34 adenosine deaminase TadA [Pigmentiphaga kullae]